MALNQSEPMVSDLITKRFDRPFLVSVNFTQAASYAVGNCMGPSGAGLAKLTIDMSAAAGVNMANALVKIRAGRLNITAGTVTAAGAATLFLFPTQPAGTFTDAATPTVSQADAAILASGIILAFGSAINNLATGMAVFGLASFSQDQTLTCDSTGKLYLTIQSQGTHTYTTPTGFNLRLECTR